MSDYTVTMRRSPGLSEAELRARLGRVYELILRRASENETSADESFGEPTAEAVEKPAGIADHSS